jgi:threonine dehydrogenase-like Zn-dependent dehydrogenase
MHATIMYEAGDVRVETVPGARIVEPTDALLRDRHRRGHRCRGADAEERRPRRDAVAELLPEVLDGRTQPGRVFDRVVGLDEVPDGYRAMNERESIKVMVKPG